MGKIPINSDNEDQFRGLFGSFLVSLLTAIAGICIRRGWKFRGFTEAAKHAFLRAAIAELDSSGTELSVSRLSVMTGLQRKDIKRLHSSTDESPTSPNLLIKLLGTWRQHPHFANKKGPRALSYDGPDSEFAALVSSVSSDLNPYTLLFELERTESIERKGDRLFLRTDTYVPTDDVRNGLELLADDVADLLIGVEDNLFDSAEQPNLHIKTHYDNICPEYLPKIRKWFLKKGAMFHAETRGFLAQFDKDLNPELYNKKGGLRVAVGSFSRTDKVESTEKIKPKEK